MNRRFVLACLVACSAVGLSAAEARAQVHVDFLFSDGGYRHHHHHYPHYRYYGDYYWYAPPPVRYVPVAAPPQVVYVPTPVSAAPTVAAPTAAMQAPSLAPATASTPTAATPNLRTNTVPNQSSVRETSSSVRETVNIANPAGSGGVVSFIVDGKQEVTLAPGESTTMKDAGSYAVEFDRGETYGTTRIVLNEGTYEFEVTASGWDLQRRSSVASTNSLRPVVRRNTLPTQR